MRSAINRQDTGGHLSVAVIGTMRPRLASGIADQMILKSMLAASRKHKESQGGEGKKKKGM